MERGAMKVIPVPAFVTSLCVLLGQLTLAGSYAGCTSCSSSSSQATCNQNYPTDGGAILACVLANASSTTRPYFLEGRATVVKVDVYFNSFDSISVDTMDYAVNIYMRQRWDDPRLAYGQQYPNISHLSLDYKLFDAIWVPDLFFPNEKASSTHCVTVPNAMIRIYPNGSVLFSSRYTLQLACHMDLHRFPLDQQICYMKMESYAFTQDEIELHWSEIDPLQVTESLTLPQFELLDRKEEECESSYNVGNYSCLQAKMRLRRQYGYYMIQTYVPSILIVSLSWVSFWINIGEHHLAVTCIPLGISIDAVPARISLGVLTVLTLTTQSVGVWMSLPRVSYVKAIDIWMATCIFAVYAAMLEFAIVNTLSRKEIRRMTMRVREQDKDRPVNHSAEQDMVGDQADTATPQNGDQNAAHDKDLMKRVLEEYMYGNVRRFDPKTRMLARRVDKISRWLFPIAFFVFNTVYWTYFLIYPAEHLN